MKSFVLTKPRSWLEAYLPLVLWGAFIFLLSAQSALPGLDGSSLDYFFKKLSHITVYAILYILSVRTVLYHTNKQYDTFWYVPFLLCFIYALTDEIHQSYVPYRTSSVRDLGYDMLGASIVFLRQYRYI